MHCDRMARQRCLLAGGLTGGNAGCNFKLSTRHQLQVYSAQVTTQFQTLLLTSHNNSKYLEPKSFTQLLLPCGGGIRDTCTHKAQQINLAKQRILS